MYFFIKHLGVFGFAKTKPPTNFIYTSIDDMPLGDKFDMTPKPCLIRLEGEKIRLAFICNFDVYLAYEPKHPSILESTSDDTYERS